MEIPVLVEQLGDARFIARSGEPMALGAEGSSHDEAVTKLEELFHQKLARGARLDSIHVPADHPLTPYAGSLPPDDPMTREYLQAVADYRRERDEEDAKAG